MYMQGCIRNRKGKPSMKFKNDYVQRVYDSVAARNPNEPEFLQAVGEVLESLVPVVEKNPSIEKNAILERITEPERAIHGFCIV